VVRAPRRKINVYLTPEELDLLDRACKVFGEDRSRLIVTLLLNYLKDLNVIRESLHASSNVPHST